MKKNILFHKLLTLISVVMLLSCFGLDEKNNKMATILLTNLDFFAEIIGYSMIGLPRIFWMFFMGTPLEPFRAGMIARIFITILSK